VTKNGQETDAKLASHADVYVVSQKYQLTELQEAASNEIRDASWYSDEAITPSAGLLSCLRILFTQTQDSDSIARPMAAKFCAEHLASLRKHKEFLSLLRDVPELGQDILESDRLHVGKRRETMYLCPNCDVVCDTHSCTDLEERKEEDCGCWAKHPRCRYCKDRSGTWSENMHAFVQEGT